MPTSGKDLDAQNLIFILKRDIFFIFIIVYMFIWIK